MGLKSFLQQQGFIEDDAAGKNKQADKPAGAPAIAPAYFPVDTINQPGGKIAGTDPSFVSPLPRAIGNAGEQPDPSFIKFFEDELVKSNLPGPDYFEFRQLLLKTQ